MKALPKNKKQRHEIYKKALELLPITGREGYICNALSLLDNIDCDNLIEAGFELVRLSPIDYMEEVVYTCVSVANYNSGKHLSATHDCMAVRETMLMFAIEMTR